VHEHQIADKPLQNFERVILNTVSSSFVPLDGALCIVYLWMVLLCIVYNTAL
jgi:hypothetical protein